MRRISKNKKAFTLAEVLITLVVIGVISALTIPALLQNLQDAQLKAAFKNDYSVINAAYNSLVQNNGGSVKGVYNSVDEFASALKDKLNYAKYCPLGSASDCLPQLNEYKYLDNTSGSHPTGCLSPMISDQGNVSTWASIVLSNGSIILIPAWNKNCTASDAYINNACSSTGGSINIDVNGNKGPNIFGKDLFAIMPYESVMKPAGISVNMPPYTLGYTGCDAGSCRTSSSGFGCAAKVLKE